jgi:hypothetical protein
MAAPPGFGPGEQFRQSTRHTLCSGGKIVHLLITGRTLTERWLRFFGSAATLFAHLCRLNLAQSLERDGANCLGILFIGLGDLDDVLRYRFGQRVIAAIAQMKQNQCTFVRVCHALDVVWLECGVLEQAINGHGTPLTKIRC